MEYPKIVVTPPGPKAKNIVKRDSKYISPSFGRAYPLVVEKGEGNIITDVDGNKFIDMNAGLAVCSVGHSHPKVVKSIKEQAEKFLHYSYTDFFYGSYIDLGEKLHSLLPGKYKKKFYYGNSGAEAVEAAIKVSRYHTGRQGVMAYMGAFHGRTMGAVSLTASKPYQRAHFSPLVPGVVHLPYPNSYRSPFTGKKDPEIVDKCLHYLEMILETYQPPEEVAMIIAEPIQGEGGYVVPPEGYFKEVKKICDEHNILFAVDEIQSGIGRTGKWFAIEHYDVVPDIVCIAKGIAAGLPLGVMASRADVQDWKPGSHASTFGGNPVSCAAAISVLNTIQEENLLKNAEEHGDYILKRLHEMQEDHPIIGDVRGKGLMIGVELVKDRKTQEYAKEESKELMTRCFKKGVALVTCGFSVIRMMPPLTITRKLINSALDIFEESLTEVEDKYL